MVQLAVRCDVANDAEDFGSWTDYLIPADRSAWHPLSARLYEYWLAAAPPGRLPGRQHILPEDLAPLWSRLCMLDVIQWPLRYRYRYCGTELVRGFGREATGRWLDEMHPQSVVNPQSRDRFRFMAFTGAPTWRRGKPFWTRNGDHRTVESCFVPLAADGFTVDKILGVTVAFDSAGREI